MKHIKLCISLLVMVGLVLATCPCAGAQEWSKTPEGGYQPVKLYVPEEDPAARPPEENLTAEEKVQIIKASEQAIRQVNREDGMAFVTEKMERMAKVDYTTSSSTEEMRIVEFSADGKMITGAEKTSEQATNGIAEKRIMENAGKPAGSDSSKTGAADLLGFLAMQNDNPLSSTASDSGKIKSIILHMQSSDRTAEENPSVSVNPLVVQVLDSVSFNDHVRAIYELLNPPDDIHPWLKWLLYSSRVTGDMVTSYNATLQKRDQIYRKACESNGKLTIMYKGRILGHPILALPEWGNGEYALVAVQSAVS
ncbi:MAG: hypothetical protein WC352_03990 [Candidatus Omnitrophota bacterium]|jgi:hypothetical protein